MAVGNLEFIKSATGSSVATLSVTDCFSDNYDVYAIIMGNSDMLNDAGFFRYRFLDSGGSVIDAAEYDNAGIRFTTSTFTEARSENATYMSGISSSTGALTAEGGTAITYVFQPYDSSSFTFTLTQSVNANGSSNLQGYRFINCHKSAEQITGFHILSDPAKTFETVEFSVYGVK